MTDSAPGAADLVTADDVLIATTVVADALAAADDDRWDTPAGELDWSCRHTLGHVVDCLVWYGANLARRSTGFIEVPEMAPTAAAPILIDALRSGGALLSAAVKAAEPDQRGFHPFGIADRSGFAAMGCDEVLVHGADLAAGLGFAYEPPGDVCEHVVRRLFPWAPTDSPPWPTLLWANGRAALGNLQPTHSWLWQCAPLSEWDGRPRQMPG